MHLNRRQYNTLYALVRVGTEPPQGGSVSTTPAALASYAKRASRAATLALRILQEVPPHADKYPLDMVKALDKAETFLKEEP